MFSRFSLFACLIAAAAIGCGRTDPVNRTVLVVLDGGTWNALTPLLQEGELPHIRALMAEGTYGPLRTDPPFSPPSWTSLATGMTPEHHGIDNFVRRETTVDDLYELVPIRADDIEVPRIWNIFSHSGVPVAILRWLFTWPVERVLGVVTSDHRGLGVDFLRNEDLDGQLRSQYQRRLFIDGDARLTLDPSLAWDPARSPQEFRERDQQLDEAILDVDRAEQAFEFVRSSYPEIEFLAVAFFWGNQIQHEFLHYWQAPVTYGSAAEDVERYRHAVPDLYRQLDRFVGDLRDDPGVAHVILASDHGMELIPMGIEISLSVYHLQLRLDELLADLGYLQWTENDDTDARSIDFDRSQAHQVAWRRTESGIGLLRRDRGERRGTIMDAPEAARVRDAIARDLAAVHFIDDGTPLFSEIAPPDTPWPDLVIGRYATLTYAELPELFSRNIKVGDSVVPCGRYVRFAGRDIRSEHGYDLNPSVPMGKDGILLLSGPSFRDGLRLDRGSVTAPDLTPTLLHLHGLPVGEDMDGRVLTEAFEPSLLESHPPISIPSYGAVLSPKEFVDGSAPDRTSDFDRETMERLRALGYVN